MAGFNSDLRSKKFEESPRDRSAIDLRTETLTTKLGPVVEVDLRS